MRLKFTLLKLSITLLTCLSAAQLWAQASDTSLIPKSCAVEPNYFSRRDGSTALMPSTTSFPPSAIMHCGKIDAYFVDVAQHFNSGFNDSTLVPGGGYLGEVRRNTYCAALSYIQSVIDFSNVADTTPIRILIDTSLAPGVLPAYTFSSPVTFLARAFPQFDSSNNGIKKGFMCDYITSPTWHLHDSLPITQFHGILQFNFDKVYAVLPTGFVWDSGAIIWQNDYSAPFISYCTSCLYFSPACNKMDLEWIAIHETTHCMGWFSNIGFTGTGTVGLTPIPLTSTNPHIFSALDWSYYVSPNTYPLTLTKLLTGTTAFPILNSADPDYQCNNNYWLNDSAAPDNHPVYSGGYPSGVVHSYLSHLDDQQANYTIRERISPGDQQDYIMGPFGLYGVPRRTYAKGEIHGLVDALGFTLLHSFDSTNPNVYHNHVPFSKKMANYGITIANYGYFTETVAADDTMTNNTGSSRTYYIDTLVARGDLTDEDTADIPHLYIDTNTIVNFRGCGIGGNNHLALSVSADAKSITYTPRGNFYGRAQWGYNIADGKNDGSFVVMTVEVYKGTNDSCPIATNMICNPTFEDGSEVKEWVLSENHTNTAISEDNLHEGKWQGIQFSDGHPYCFNSNFNTDMFYSGYNLGITSGTVVQYSSYGCGYTDVTTTSYDGNYALSAPASGTGLLDNPYSKDSVGLRYQFFGTPGGSYYNLLDSVRHCHKYTLEFDLYRQSGAFGTTLPLDIGFADHTVNLEAIPYPDTSLNFMVKDTIPFTTHAWVHYTIPINYCGTKPSNILYLAHDTSDIYAREYFHIDNLSLKEDTSAPLPLLVTITKTPLAGCITKLQANVTNPFCAVSYLWSGTEETTTTAALDTVSTTVVATYTVNVTDGCRDTFAATSIFYTPPAVITGTLTVCAGSTTTLSDSVSGCTWTSSNTAIATVGSGTGIVTGVAGGTAVISYPDSCGLYATATVTVNPLPVSISGPSGVCAGFTITETDASGGGSWSSSNTAIAVIGSGTGIITGVSAGTAVITYTLGTGCITTKTITVSASPAIITGSHSVCTGQTTPLSDATGGGTWTSSNTAIATIGSATGVVTGVAAGTTTISYIAGGCYATFTVTVVTTPALITGVPSVCVGLTTTLSDLSTGGVWSSANTAIAIIGSGSGIVTGVATGTTTITYTLGTSCYVTRLITVNPLPAAIGGTAAVCVGATTTLTDATGTGIWTSSNTAIATIGSGTGVVTGIAAGTATISYTLSTGCPATIVVTVNGNPVISGSIPLCPGATITLSSSISGGTWISGTTGIATIGSGTGVVTGVASGTTTITYTVTATGCTGTTVVTVNPLPSAITGASGVCIGASTTLSDLTSGGAWSSSNIAVAAIGSGTGIATGVSAGTTTITYKLATGCYTTALLTVNPLPAAITGTTSVCVAQTTTLADVTGGGSWTSSNTAIATVGSGTGTVTGVAGGTVMITYTLSTGCIATIVVTVNPLPAAIGGTSLLCTGTTATLTDATGGGVWGSSNTAIATIGSSSGIVSGIASGTVTVTYSIGTSCTATKVLTVNTSPAVITGTLSVCTGATTTLGDLTSGGTWSSGTTAVATIGSLSGIATGVSSGTAGITYTVSTGCRAIATLTVNPLPAAITGGALVCAGLTETLSDVTGGGVWTSSNTAIATIGSGTGIVTGVSTGSTTITYRLPTGCYTTFALTGITAPATITGTLTVCPGASTTLSDATPGGSWTSSTTGIAVVGSGSGIVSGTGSGTATITYSLGGSCYQTVVVTVNTAPTAYAVVGGGSYCSGGTGVHIGLFSSHTGVTYQLYHSGTAVGSPVPGSGGALDFGLQTAGGTYTVIATDTTSGCASAMTGSATVGISPLPGVISGLASLCAGSSITLTDTSTAGTWSSSTIAIATVGSGTGIVAGITPGTDTIRYTVTGTGCSQVKLVTVNTMPVAITGNMKVCLGATDTLSDATAGGTWAATNTHATIGTGTGIVTGVSSGADTIIYGFPLTGCGVKTIIQVLDTVCAPCMVFGNNFTELDSAGFVNSNRGPGNYYVANNVVIKGNDTFNNAIILIAPGDTIYVDSSARLSLDSCHLFSLCQQWQGMVLKPGRTRSGRLFVTNNSLIENSMCAVYIPNAVTPTDTGYIFKSDGALFNQNVVGVFIQHYTPNIPVYPFLVRNTVFTSRDFQTHNHGFPKQWPPTLGTGGLKNYWNPADTFLAPFNINDSTPGLGYAYPAVSCYGGILPTNGIRLDSVGTNTPGSSRSTGVAIPATYAEMVIGDITPTGNNQYQNLFDHLRYGIFGLNSNITSVNNAFTNLFATNIGTLPGTPSGGDGVYVGATDDIVNENRLRVYTPVGSNYKNVFYDFNIGVEASNYFQVISDSTYMTNKYFGTLFGPPAGTGGYYIKTAKYDTINISGNMVNNVVTAVAVWMAYDPTVRIAHIGGTAITLPSQYMGLCNINNNVIQAHPIWTAPLTTQQVSIGISYQNTVMLPSSSVTEYLDNLNINYNTIHDAYNGVFVNGYWATRGVEPYTSVNTIYLRQQAGNHQQYGVNYTNSQNGRVYYNEVTGTMAYSDTTNNMRAYYAASNSLMDLGCNDESQIGRGYEFYLTSPGMEWHSNTMNDNAKGMVLNGAVIGPQHIGLTTMNNAWLGSWPASVMQTYVYNGANPISSPFWVASSPLTNPTNNQSAAFGFNYGFAPGSILVLPTTSIAPCLPVYGSSLTDTSNLLSQIAMQHVDYTLNVVPSNWMGQYALWKSTRMDTTIVDSSAIIAQFVVMADSMSRFKYLTDIEYALSTGDLTTANYLLALPIDGMANTAGDSATQVKMADDVTADNIVENYQQFYSLYIKYVSGTMASTDSLEIMALAQLCPEHNGTVVFQARALYSNIYNDLSMFNDDSCLSADTTYVASRHNPVIKQTSDSTRTVQLYTLHPNPSDGNIVLQQAVPDGQPVKAEVWSAVGVNIFKDQLYFTNGVDRLHVVNAAPGLYLLRLTDNKNRQFILKFVIE